MYLEKCTDTQLKNIYDELHITEESLKRDVNYLMDWFEKQPHLPNVKDEQILANTLIQCKNSLEKAKRKLDLYYCARAILPEVFTNRDPEDDAFKRVFFSGCFVPLPTLTPEGDRVAFWAIFDPIQANLTTADEFMKISYTIFEILLKTNACRKHIFVIDAENVSLTLLTQIVKGFKKIATAVSKDMNIARINKTVFFHMNSKMATLMNLAKSFLTKKMADTLEIWDTETDLSKIVPIEIIPSNYGGKGKPLEELRNEFYEYALTFREWLKLQNEIKGDISKRTDDLFKGVSLHGVDGTFRQLSLD